MKPFLLALLLAVLPLAVSAAPAPELQEYTYCGCCPCCPDADLSGVKDVCLSHRKGESLDLLVKNLKTHCKATKETCNQNPGKANQCSLPRRHYKYCDGPWPPMLYDPTPGAPTHSN